MPFDEAVLRPYDGDRMPGARWFPRARLNFAENLLRGADSAAAVIYRGEDGTRRQMSGAALRALVTLPISDLRSDFQKGWDIMNLILPIGPRRP